MKLVVSAAVAATALFAAPAMAQEADTGAYVSLGAGIASVEDLDVAYYDGSDSVDFSFDTNSAAVFRGTVGYDFGMVRADLEVSYHRNKVSAITLEGVNGTAVTLTPADRADVCDLLDADTCGGSGNTFNIEGGRARQLSALANVWFDLPLGPVTPYAGGGLGVTGYELDGEGEARFAWQLGAGLAFNLSSNIALTGDYRFRQANGVTIEDEDFPGEGVRLGKVKTHTFTAGVRFGF